jgi:hypothetical protein
MLAIGATALLVFPIGVVDLRSHCPEAHPDHKADDTALFGRSCPCSPAERQ